MDSDEDAPPPPPPSSPPPGGELEQKKPASRSEKFKALQGMLSSVPTMYSSPESRAAPPPPKKPHTDLVNEEEGEEESPKLKHTTRDRPKRKVRPPSRKGKSGRDADEPKSEDQREEIATHEELPPDLPPPPPPLSELPSEMPGDNIEMEDTQKEDSSSLFETFALTESSQPTHKSPRSSPSISGADHGSHWPTSAVDKITTKATFFSSPKIRGDNSHREVAESAVSEVNPPLATPPLASPVSTSPSLTDSPRSKGIVMGSFSERLKRIRENRSSRKNSPSLKTSTSMTVASDKQHTARQTSLSDLMTTPSSLTTSLTTSPALSIRSTSSSVSYGADSTSSVSAFRQPPTSNSVEAYTEQVPLRASGILGKTTDAFTRMSDSEQVATPRVPSSLSLDTSSLESEEEPKSQQNTRRSLQVKKDVSQSSLSSENAVSAEIDAGSKETWNSEGPSLDNGAPPQAEDVSPAHGFLPMDEEDEGMPTAPPPPIPDLPPPSDDIPVGESDSKESESIPEDEGQRTADKVPKDGKMTSKASFRTIRRKEEWKRKSEELDSGMFDPLPLLVSNKSSKNHSPEPVYEEDERPHARHMTKKPSQVIKEEEEEEADVLHGSSESLPSLPESPPPQLPDGPPPDLPSSFPPDEIEFESDALGEIIISETLLTPPLGEASDENEEIKSSSSPSLEQTAPVIEKVDAPLATISTPVSMPSPELVTPMGSEKPEEKHRDEVQLRKPKRATNGASPMYRRSAFDALVSVEPTSEEKKEPKLSSEQRRSLALEASRRSDADTSSFLEQWNGVSLSSGAPERKLENADSEVNISKENETNEVPEKQEWSREVKEPHDSEDNSSGLTLKLLSAKGLSVGRPQSFAGVDDLEANQRRVKDDDSRWSLPPNSDIFQKVSRNLTSQDESPSLGHDRNFRKISKDKWKNIDLLTTGEAPSLSASTGQLFSKGGTQQHGEREKAGLKTSLHSLNSSSESLPPFVGLRRSPQKFPRRPHSMSPLAATALSVAPTTSKEEQISTTNMDEKMDTSDSPQQISYAEKLRVQSKASERKRRSLVLSGDDPIMADDDPALKGVPLRDKRRLKNLQLASVQDDSRALDSPRPASLVLDRDILKTDPSKWSIDEVCQWLELIGLGAFRQAFRERGVDGTLLLQIDVQLFDELGVDSHEIREVFLAKIYELSNPRFSAGGMEDDFRLTVDEYTNEDWKKFQAAVSVLKSPILGDSIELEPSAIGEYIHTEYIRSHSTPNIYKVTNMQGDLSRAQYMSPGKHFVFPSPIEDDRSDTPHTGEYPVSSSLLASHNRWRRKSEPYSTPILGADLMLNEMSGDERLAEWVAELPDSSYGRSRALTAPSNGPMKRIRKSSDSEVMSTQFRQSLPRDLRLDDKSLLPDGGNGGDSLEAEPTVAAELPTPTRKTSNREKRPSRQQSSSPVKSEVSLGPAGLVRLHMDTIQKGTYYKSFVADTSTTAEQLVKLALEKIDLNIQEYKNFCIVEKTVGEKGQPQRKAMKPSQPILAVQSKWPQEDGYCLELRRRRLPQQDKGEGARPPPSTSSVAAPTVSNNTDKRPSQEQLPWEQEKLDLQRQLESIKLQLESKEDLEEKLKSLQEKNSAMTVKLEELKQSQQLTSSELQDKVDTLNLEKQKLEDQVLMIRAAASTSKVGPDVVRSEDDEDPAHLLEQVQSRYEAELLKLTGELREKERQNQEMSSSISEMESKMVEIKAKSEEEVKRNNRLLGERNQQIHSLEKDLAIKEETIQKLRLEIEDAQLSADQMLAYQNTLQAMEVTSKQQQEFMNRTVRDLKEQLSRLMIENSQQEQLAQAVRKERDRLVREQQAKDALVASLEADLTSYRTLCSASTTESSRVQALQQSLSVHEVAIASLRGEFQRQSGELKLAGEEVTRLRKSLAKKEQQLVLLSEEPSRASFFDLLSDLPPHSLATAEVIPSPSLVNGERNGSERSRESEDLRGEDSVIEVMSSPGTRQVSGSVVVSVPKRLEGCGVQPRDWVLEINGTNVASKSYRETNKLLVHHHQAGSVVKIVLARPLDSVAPVEHSASLQEGDKAETDSMEQYHKLNTSLNAKLEFQSAEVDHWKQECERLKDDLLRYSIAQQDKDSELKYLQAAVQDFKYQLEDSEKARSKLEVAERTASGLKKGELEVSFQKMKEELKKMKSAEKARVAQLKKLQQDKNKALQLLRQQMMSSEDLQDAMRDFPPTEEASLSNASRSELMKRLRNVEEDFSRHKVYLDQLLTVIIDQNPQLLSKLGDVQRLRDQMEADADSWC